MDVALSFSRINISNAPEQKVIMKKIAYYCSSAIFVCIFGMECLAEPVDTPADSWEHYDLIAKVMVRSVDATREIQTYDSPEAQSFYQPAEVEVIEPLRLPTEAGPLNLLVPSHSFYRGKRLESYYLESGLFPSTNVLALACRYSDDKKWLILEWMLSEEMWQTYRKQKETGVVEHSASAQEEEDKQLLDAAQRMKELIKQKDEGSIGWEEYHKRAEPLREILNSQFDKSHENL